MTDTTHTNESLTPDEDTQRRAEEIAKRILRPDASPYSWGGGINQQVEAAYSDGDDASVRGILDYEQQLLAPKDDPKKPLAN